ncbi:ISAs1 family transposase [Myxococcus sp. SDU36]|uniref:ISAs1 family transposase n=1 Tax=Myxococcus sp. SDU36 TaxID=2831967 RepID=UPI0025437D1A|nr:ISAs1 family transposase [Myxococcus sp. SDU36]WIG93323.1 ISAs1 family transposase [Myxococcus sp. SDU36]
MGGLRGQQRRVLRQARLPWDDAVRDPRDARGTRHEHLGLLGLVVAGFAVGKKGLKQAAQLAGDVGARTRKRLELPRSVKGSTLWRLLRKQQTDGLRETLRAQACEVLEDSSAPRLPFPLGVVSVDGKSLWTTHQGEVEGLEAVANDEVGRELWRLGALRAVHTSALAAPCLDLEFIGAKEGESPAFRQLLPRVVEAFGKHFGVVTADAGLTAAQNAALVRELGKHYCFGLKANQPTLHEYAMRAIASKQCPARSRTEERAHGQTVVRELWTHALTPDEVDFPGARTLLLVRQQHWDDEDNLRAEDYRYFVTSLDTTVFNFHQLLRLVRVHWGIENRHNWTLDVVLGEDARQPCRPTRTALEVVAWLRAMAFNLLSCFRTRLPPQGRHLVEWTRACELLRDSLVHGRRQTAFATPD